jgi:hypothetical protein
MVIIKHGKNVKINTKRHCFIVPEEIHSVFTAELIAALIATLIAGLLAAHEMTGGCR